MMLYLNIFLLFFVVFLLVILSWVWPPDSPWSPWWRTNSKKSMAAATLANISSRDIVYELGSGEAVFLITIAKKIGAKCVGIEIEPVRNFLAKISVLLNGVSKKVTLNRGSFYDYKLNSATVVYVYLVPRVLEKLKPKLFKELKKGTRIVSNVYTFRPDKRLKLVHSDPKNKLHLYRII